MPRGGPRPGAGRKPKGISKAVRLNLPKEAWDRLEQDAKQDGTQADTLRRIVLNHYQIEDANREGD